MMRAWMLAAAGAVGMLSAWSAGLSGRPAPAGWPGDSVPRYAGDALIRPDGFERWILAGASLGLGYSAAGGADLAGGGELFHNVYIEPSAYRHYVRTGRFREKTMLAMTLYAPARKLHPATQGQFEGEFLAAEFALKDSERFPGGWAYFDFGTRGPGSRALAMPRDACQSCHARHAADDHVFVQFYPTLRSVSRGADGTRR
jgi:hypothetical protein